MKILARSIGLAALLICLLWANTYPATVKVQTYVSKGSLTSSLQAERLRLLFAQQMQDSIRVHTLDSLKLKDPNKAILYAVVPGIVVHGAGHFYAGATTTGWVLLAGEVLSLGIMTYAAATGFAEAMGGSNSDIDDDITAIFGATLFIGTWLYDLIGAPVVVQRENQKLLTRQNVGLKLHFDRSRDLVAFQIVKRF